MSVSYLACKCDIHEDYCYCTTTVYLHRDLSRKSPEKNVFMHVYPVLWTMLFQTFYTGKRDVFPYESPRLITRERFENDWQVSLIRQSFHNTWSDARIFPSDKSRYPRSFLDDRWLGYSFPVLYSCYGICWPVIYGNGVRHSEGRDREKPVRESPDLLYSYTGISMYPQKRLSHTSYNFGSSTLAKSRVPCTVPNPLFTFIYSCFSFSQLSSRMFYNALILSHGDPKQIKK